MPAFLKENIINLNNISFHFEVIENNLKHVLNLYCLKVRKNVHLYLKFVGYNSGVYKKRMLNDPVMADFPANVVTMEAIFALLSPPRKKNNFSVLKDYKLSIYTVNS